MQLEFWGGLKALPWIIKPVYGILSDAVPLLGYHRRSYLVIFGILGKYLTSWSACMLCTWVCCPALRLHATCFLHTRCTHHLERCLLISALLLQVLGSGWGSQGCRQHLRP